MKLILQTDVKNLGKTGDQISVKKGFARNYLIPKGYAVLMNKNRLKAWEHQKVIIEAKKRKAVSERKALIEKLSSIKLKFEKEAQKDNRLFGSVTAHEISQSLEKLHKLSVDKRDIHFSELKTVGEHSVSIKLDSENQTEIKLSIKGKIRKAEYETKTPDLKPPSQTDSLSDAATEAIKETADTEAKADTAKSLKKEEGKSDLSDSASQKAKSSENKKTIEKPESKKKIEKDMAKHLETTEEKNLSDFVAQREEPVESPKKETKKSLKEESFKSAKALPKDKSELEDKTEPKDRSESKGKVEKAKESSKKLEGNLKAGQSTEELAEKATALKPEETTQAQSDSRDKTEKADSFNSKVEEKKLDPAKQEKSKEESKAKKSGGFFKNLFRKK